MGTYARFTACHLFRADWKIEIFLRPQIRSDYHCFYSRGGLVLNRPSDLVSDGRNLLVLIFEIWLQIELIQVRSDNAGAARRRVHLSTVLLRSPCGHRPCPYPSRLHLTQKGSLWTPPGMAQPLGSRQECIR